MYELSKALEELNILIEEVVVESDQGDAKFAVKGLNLEEARAFEKLLPLLGGQVSSGRNHGWLGQGSVIHKLAEKPDADKINALVSFLPFVPKDVFESGHELVKIGKFSTPEKMKKLESFLPILEEKYTGNRFSKLLKTLATKSSMGQIIELEKFAETLPNNSVYTQSFLLEDLAEKAPAEGIKALTGLVPLIEEHVEDDKKIDVLKQLGVNSAPAQMKALESIIPLIGDMPDVLMKLGVDSIPKQITTLTSLHDQIPKDKDRAVILKSLGTAAPKDMELALNNMIALKESKMSLDENNLEFAHNLAKKGASISEKQTQEPEAAATTPAAEQGKVAVQGK